VLAAMNGYLVKALAIIVLLAGVIPVYHSMPRGDRAFAVVLWLVFSGLVGFLVLIMPLVRCPGCGWVTPYFDNYSAWRARMTGYARRNVKCPKCHTIIDRLNGSEVGQMPRDEARILDRLVFMIRLRLGLLWVGGALIIASIGVAIIIVQILRQENAHRDRGGVVLFGCGLVFLLGIVLWATSWWLKRKAKRLAEAHHIQMPRGIRVRW
jgi:hypothetical protein